MPPAVDVLVVGDALLDVHVAPSAPVRPGGDVPAAVRVGPGGQGANVAVRLARRGIRVRLACALGDDASGRLVHDALEADRVDLDVAPAEATGAVVILVGAGGERTMLSRRSTLLPRSVDAAPLTVVSGYALLEEAELTIAGEGRRAVLGCALPAGTEAEWWRRADDLHPAFILLNADEVHALGTDAQTLALDFGGSIVVTSPDGVTIWPSNPDLPARQLMAEGIHAVDSTGAGDAFAAAFLAELHDWPAWADVDIDRALSAGLELAAQVAGVAGAQARVPLEERVTRP